MITGALILTNPKHVQNEIFDPRRKLGNISCVQRQILTFQRAGTDYIVVLIGKYEDELAKHISQTGVICLRDEEPAEEMYDRVKNGLSYLQPHCDQILITPADVPLFSVETVRVLMENGAMLANPVWRGKRGHPLLLHSTLIPSFLGYSGKGGLRGALKACKTARVDIEVEDNGVLLDVEDTEPEEKLINRHSIACLHPVIQISLSKGEAFFGAKTFQLLRLVDIVGSVRKASEQIGLSYSKAWKILKFAETQAGYKLVQRQQGGAKGGKATLTNRGRSLMERYDAFEKEITDQAKEAFERHFGNFDLIGAEE